ncbi:MAG: fumarylacetoacetate hydrolase family protein [Acidimicrobiia bacterium]
MRLVTFADDRGLRIGVLAAEDEYRCIADVSAGDGDFPTDMVEFLTMGTAGREWAGSLMDGAPRIPMDDVELFAPVPRPDKIVGIGLNYADHAAESSMQVPDSPAVFAKFSNAVIGHRQSIVLPKVTNQVDYEGELGVVIGRSSRNVAPARGLDHVAGYVVVNDVSARDYQFHTGQWTAGKTFDTFAPMGPSLTTCDEVGDPHHLSIRTFVNGELRQDSSTSRMIFGVPQLVASLTTIMSLSPGDVIATGTPPGVGFARTPPQFLRPGDVVRIDIERVGILENPVVAEQC